MEKKKKKAAAQGEPAPAAGPAETEKKTETAEAEIEPAPAPDPLEALQKEYDEHRQQYLRVLAEYDNYRKRTQNEKTAIYNNAVADTVQQILTIADNIDRALDQENAGAEDLRKGIEMIRTQIGSVFEKLGVTEIGKAGEPFDPNLHNAVSHIEDEERGENEIALVFQKGYLLGDRLIRPAMVQVAN